MKLAYHSCHFFLKMYNFSLIIKNTHRQTPTRSLLDSSESRALAFYTCMQPNGIQSSTTTLSPAKIDPTAPPPKKASKQAKMINSK